MTAASSALQQPLSNFRYEIVAPFSIMSLSTLRKRFYRPDKLNADWDAAVERHRPLIESRENMDAFEQAMSDLLAELGTSHLGFFHASARRASSRAALERNIPRRPDALRKSLDISGCAWRRCRRHRRYRTRRYSSDG